ncbi:hypothetical protein PHISCL_06998 [Aspergillus sclerotialis]|uniref:Altered inheritance of mitochondria protein 24, mitochondrial n=1 Tax=Aspergillus sclerotialis TaxID=2070753 RepID=A0A3A2ZRQ8_9EURO|nr:hypothetical protein PHISCL_06998 [Aspergillus sclerotialis]
MKSVAHWGSSEVTGRGLLALVGNGQLYSIELKQGEQYIAHPSNVVAYTMNSNPPGPYRFKSTTLNFQVPGLKSLPRIIQNTKFIRDMSDSDTWKTAMRIFHKLRTWSRMTIWGDRLFVQFDGPATLLVQSRGPRINDVMSAREVNEIADSPRGVTINPTEQKQQPSQDAESDSPVPPRPAGDSIQEAKGTNQSIASVTKEGKVEFEKPGQKN